VSDPVVELRDVFCVHRTNQGDAAALQGTNLELSAGELLCVLGPSGAGKSTLLRVIGGIQMPSAGTVYVVGHDIGRLSLRARARIRHRHLGFVGQDTEASLPPDLPAAEAVALPLALRGVGTRARRARVEELLDAAALRERAGARPDELSGGERQRLALCAALAHRPKLLLADEPTGELDEASAEAMRTLIAELARATGGSVIIASHDPAMATVAGRTVGIRDGRVVEDRIGGESALVIGRGGWLRLPSEVLTAARLGPRVRAQPHADGVIITATASDPVRVAPRRRAPRIAAAKGDWSPARVDALSVSRGYGSRQRWRPVINGLTHRFAPGRLTAVTGPSGVGKTTLLRLLAGLDHADQGDVLIDHRPLGPADAEELARRRRERIGYMPQEPWPVEFLSAEENVVLALRLRQWPPGAAAERASAALARVGLANRTSQRVHRLSAGEAQRVALARSLASARGLVIVDEPTSRLDEVTAGKVARLLAAAAAEDGQTVICATHDPAVIEEADEMVELGRRPRHTR
jgi:peptide/nickel transport system ATP-binding protein